MGFWFIFIYLPVEDINKKYIFCLMHFFYFFLVMKRYKKVKYNMIESTSGYFDFLFDSQFQFFAFVGFVTVFLTKPVIIFFYFYLKKHMKKKWDFWLTIIFFQIAINIVTFCYLRILFYKFFKVQIITSVGKSFFDFFKSLK
ncbi:hypothetical protein ATP_00061 [Candidatus Phytoplasma mali]|uniref:Uncharacterized protein n=2 Tax=Apple proliferation phytoplasma TaxID=37692 RepID=B3R084_PHYMT|nr:hypothetical protein ATP_00061 [Candidatus Phytoplasma mali]